MKSAGTRLFAAWVSAIVTIIVTRRIAQFIAVMHFSSPVLSIISFFGWIVFVTVTLYGLAIGFRFILRRLFWRVGRRLALSYFLIGLLPFVFFAIVLAVAGYLMAGILSQAAFRNARHAALTRIDQQNLEYVLTSRKPSDTLPSLEIYDSADRSTMKNLPDWLRQGSFLGLVQRGKVALMVSARSYELPSRRTVVFVQPLDNFWADDLQKKNGMMVSLALAKADSDMSPTGHARVRVKDSTYDIGDNDSIEPFFRKAWRRNGVIWGDFTPALTDWSAGDTAGDSRLITFFSNPWSNLLDFYFGGSEYVNVVLGVILGVASVLAVIYFVALMFAGGMIYSISRAVNRIEKGTKAVEKGDFTYRIAMKPRNQLGEMAISFDHMTESIASLLGKVAEQERLQSEIDIAASIQRNLLPKEGPRYHGVSFSAHFEPTASIGGDYYDVFNLDHSRLAVAIGDVSGHGLSTGIVMAMVKAAITTLVEEGADERSLFVRLNDLVLRSTDKRAFMTLGFTIFDLEARTIRHTNAGHLYPYLLRDGNAPRPIEGPSLPLGVRSEVHPKTAELALEEGDTIVYLSDGIVEAQDDTGEPFGFDHLEKTLAAVTGESPASVQSAILAAVQEHAGGRPADDDRTVMVLRFDEVSTQMTATPEPAMAVVE